MNALDWADPAFTGRLSLTLLHSLWQVALLACAAWGLEQLWPRRAPHRTYNACVLLLCVAVVALPVTFLLVDVPAIAVVERPASMVGELDTARPSPSLERTPGAGAQAAPPPVPPQRIAVPPVVVQTRWTKSEPPAKQPAAEKSPAWLSFTPWLASAYFAGVVAMLLRLLISIRRAGRLIESATVIDSGPIVEMLWSLARTWSMKAAPVLALAETVVVPKVVGILRPTILLPSSALMGLTPGELELVLTHELAHIRRHDMWVNLLQRIAEAALFFHPGLWYLSGRISVLREYCCDEMACAATEAGKEVADADVRARYALALLRVVELMQNAPAPKRAAALAVSGRSPSELRRRIARLFGEPLCEPVRMSRSGMFVVAATVLLLVLGSVAWNPIAQSRGQDGETIAESPIKSAEGPTTKKTTQKESAASLEDGSARISGRIVLEDGSPASVKGRIYYQSIRDNNSTDSTGPECTDNFSISLPAGTVWLKYYAQDHAPAWVGPLEMGPGESRDDVKIVLNPGFSELVQVTNEQGQPVAGATVVAHPEVNNSVGGPIFEQTTDANGEVMLEHLAETRYALRITAPGYQPLRTAPLQVVKGEILRPTMTRSEPCTGVIRYADGAPAGGATLRAKYESQSDGHGVGFGNEGAGFWGAVMATADAQGRFRLGELTTGSRYLFIIEAVDGTRAIVRDLQAGREDVQIDLPPRRDLVVNIKGDLLKLSQRRGKPYINFRQRVVFRPNPKRRIGELVGADVPVEPTADGGIAIFRGLAVDLEPGEEPQQVEVMLPHNREHKSVDLNPHGNTLVEFELPEDPASGNAGADVQPTPKTDVPTIAERAVTKMVLEFFQNRSRRMIPALMIDAGGQTLVVAAGPATVVPDGTPPAIDRSYLIVPGQPRVPIVYQKTSTAELFVYLAPPGLSNYAGDAPAKLAVGDELSTVDFDRKAGEIVVVENVARVKTLDGNTELNLPDHKIRRQYQNLIEIDRVLPEGTPLFKEGQLAGLTLMGTRFLGEDAKKSYVVPADRITALAAAVGRDFKSVGTKRQPSAQPQAAQSPGAARNTRMVPPLRRPISLNVNGISRRDALKLACEKAEVPLEFDEAALADAGINLDEPVSITVNDDALVKTLSLICGIQSNSAIIFPSVIHVEFRGEAVHLTSIKAWQQWTQAQLPDWLKPLQNNGLIASLDESGDVVAITASGITTDEHLARMKTLPKLRNLRIEVTENVTAAGLQHLAEMESLEELSLHSANTAGPGLGDAAIAAVVGLTGLRQLEISECGLTDDGAKLLEDMPQLTRLRLYQEGRLTDAALASIGTLTQLKHLDLTSFVATERLGRMRFSAAGIRQLAGLKNLESLHLYGHAVPADALVFPELRSLSVGGHEVDNDAAAKIAGFRNLESLSLRETRITDEGLSNIATLPELHRLELHSGIITDRGVAELRNLPLLEQLDLRVLKATGAVLRDIAHIKTLTRLDLTSGGGNPVRGNIVDNMIPASDALRTTNALGTVWVGERWGESLRYLKACPRLDTLWLYNFSSVDGIKDLKQLRSVVLSMCDVDTAKLDELSDALPDASISSMTGADGLIRLPKRFRQQLKPLRDD